MKYYEDFSIGEEFNIGKRILTAEDIMRFAKKFDRQPMHLDPESAKKTIFGGLIASGWHLNAIFMGLLAETFKREGWASLGSPGIDSTRWPVPARPNDELLGKLEVLEKRVSKTRPFGLVRYKTGLINQREESVLQSEGTGLFSLNPNIRFM